MYAQRPARGAVLPPRFENRALLSAVRLISRSLVARASVSSNDHAYATLLSDIWGQSHFATIAILTERKRRLSQPSAKRPRPSSAPVPPSADPVPPVSKRDASRDILVRRLRTVKLDHVAANELRLTTALIYPASSASALDVDALRRLWGVPQAVFEAAALHTYLRDHHRTAPHLVARFYDRHIARAEPDARIFNVLHWKECRDAPAAKKYPPAFRTVSKAIVARVIRLLLTKRRSPFFEKNMHVVVETVLYGINPDPHVDRFRESFLRDAGFFQGIQGYEYSRSFTGALENLQLGKLNRMLKDIRAVRLIDEDHHNSNNKNNINTPQDNTDFLSLRAVTKYCAERDTLTDRALRAVFHRYVRKHRPAHRDPRVDDYELLGMTQADFVRMYLALVGSGTDTGLKYWFPILDQDGNGWVGAGDVAHFYSQRKHESEQRNGILLADVRCLWIRFCAMSGVSPKGNGLALKELKDLGREDREFMMCALLVRRADDGNLINVAATVSADVGGKCTL